MQNTVLLCSVPKEIKEMIINEGLGKAKVLFPRGLAQIIQQ